MITYDPLNKLLAAKGISRTELAKMIDVSTVTLAKLGKNESVNLSVIDKICVALKCEIEEVVRIIPENKEVYFSNLQPTQIIRAKIPGIQYSTFVIVSSVGTQEEKYYNVRPILSKRPFNKEHKTRLTSYCEMDGILDDKPITVFILNGPNTEFMLPSSEIQSVCGSIFYSDGSFQLAVMTDEQRAEIYKTFDEIPSQKNT